jgi:hypothetical protein
MAAGDGEVEKRVYYLVSNSMFHGKNGFSPTSRPIVRCLKTSELFHESLKNRTTIMVYLK